MSAEENKALVRRYIEVVWNQKNTAALDDLPAPTYQRYVSASTAPLTSEGQRQTQPRRLSLEAALANYTQGTDFTKDVSFSGNGLKKLGW